MTTGNTDVDILNETPTEVTLEDGRVVVVQRLKTRQLFKLLKIVTAGGVAGSLSSLSLPGPDEDTSEFANQLMAIVAFSIPEAENEAIEFIQSMVLPKGTILKPKSKADREANAELFADLEDYLYNPDIEDTISIIETIIRTESKDIQRLGKRLMSTFKVTQGSKPVEKPSDEPSDS
jgi:hypothetical protein